MAKFGDHVLHRLASSFLNVIRQAGRQAEKSSSLGDFFRIQYLPFGYYLVVLITIFGFGSAKTISECAFLCLRYS